MAKKLPSREEQIQATQAKSVQRNAGGKPAAAPAKAAAKPLPEAPAMSDGGEASNAVKRGSAPPTKSKPTSKAKTPAAKKAAPAKKAAAPVAEPVVVEAAAEAKTEAIDPYADWSITDIVAENFEEIAERYIKGEETLDDIAKTLPQRRLTGFQISRAIGYDRDMAITWRTLDDFRARWYIDRGATNAFKLEKAGEFKDAGDLFLKVAAKISPRMFGDKQSIELSGPEGGPIKSTVTMTPDEAYKQLLEGGS